MKKFLSLLLVCLFLVAAVSCGGGDGTATGNQTSAERLRFVTGGEAGTYYAFGSVLAQHATNNAGVKVTGIVGAGSQGNVEKLASGDAELGFCQSDVMAYAYKGERLFTEAVDNISVVAVLYTEQVQIVTLDPNIKTVADLRGKKVSIGSSGSGVYFNAMDVLGVYGMTESDIIPTYQSFGDSAEALKNGQIDAAFIVAGAPTTAVTDLAATKDTVSLVSIETDKIDELIATSPYYAKCEINKDSYAFLGDTVVTTVGVGAVILARDSVSEDAVYKFVKDIFESAASEVGTHAKYKELSVGVGASANTVPYHPGAARYFTEKGLTVPTKK